MHNKTNRKYGAIRMSKQRSIILDELLKMHNHPTADMLYRKVQDKLPRISLGTVYRNLESLSEKGYITKIDTGEGPRRYDGNTHPHLHLRCSRCDNLEDIEGLDNLKEELLAKIKSPYIIHDLIIEVRGLCPGCQKTLELESNNDSFLKH